ncbi:hypothetical protein [Nonomuraea sp. KM90]|uniref:hypothetical protein n=1 Tax=Nonomuraea sp. KM90 TaxID=3457428 RepID=UPI003FCD99C5
MKAAAFEARRVAELLRAAGWTVPVTAVVAVHGARLPRRGTLTVSGVTLLRAGRVCGWILCRPARVETTLDPGTDAGVDNITLNETMRRLARAHARAGDLKEADIVLDQLVDAFRDKDVPAPVLATIVEQAETARAQLHEHA